MKVVILDLAQRVSGIHSVTWMKPAVVQNKPFHD